MKSFAVPHFVLIFVCFHTVDACESRSDQERLFKGIRRWLGPDRRNLNPPVRQVAHPSVESQPLALPLDEPPESDPLNPAGYHPAPACRVVTAHERPRPLGIAAAGGPRRPGR